MRKESNGGFPDLQNRAKQNSSCLRLIHSRARLSTRIHKYVSNVLKPFDTVFDHESIIVCTCSGGSCS